MSPESSLSTQAFGLSIEDYLSTKVLPIGGAAQDFTGPSVPDWFRPTVVASCSAALQRIDGPHLSSVGVTSTLRREGRSTVAGVTALLQRYEYRRRTLLVEFDLQAPSLAQTMGLKNSPGITDVLRGDASIEDCVQWHDELLGVIVAGDSPTTGPIGPLLPGHRLMQHASSLADVVVVDLPPLPPHGHGAYLAPLCSTVLLVVRAGATPVAQIQHAVESLDRAPYVILNEVKQPVPRWLRPFVGR